MPRLRVLEMRMRTRDEEEMTLEDVILELYRLAESKTWDGERSDTAMVAAIEGMERIWELDQADKRQNTLGDAEKKQPRVWC